MVRTVLSVVSGIVLAVLIFLLTENLNARYFYDATLTFKEQPLPFWLTVLFGWALGSLLCGLTIRLISKQKNKTAPFIAGCLLTLSAIANFLLLSHPVWFVIVGLSIFLPFALLGHSLPKGAGIHGKDAR